MRERKKKCTFSACFSFSHLLSLYPSYVTRSLCVTTVFSVITTATMLRGLHLLAKQTAEEEPRPKGHPGHLEGRLLR